MATCVQHEVDHLNGILFIDYLSKLKKDMIIKKLVKQKKGIEKSNSLKLIMKKIVFMGTPEFSVPTLESLLKSDHKVVTVYSQPARKANRGQKINQSSVEVFC